MLATLIQEKGTAIMLHERLVADVNEMSKEIAFEHYLMALVTNDKTYKIIVIDTENIIPTYVCEVRDAKLVLSAYEARFDMDIDIQNRKENWCMLVTKMVAK